MVCTLMSSSKAVVSSNSIVKFALTGYTQFPLVIVSQVGVPSSNEILFSPQTPAPFIDSVVSSNGVKLLLYVLSICHYYGSRIMLLSLIMVSRQSSSTVIVIDCY